MKLLKPEELKNGKYYLVGDSQPPTRKRMFVGLNSLRRAIFEADARISTLVEWKYYAEVPPAPNELVKVILSRKDPDPIGMIQERTDLELKVRELIAGVGDLEFTLGEVNLALPNSRGSHNFIIQSMVTNKELEVVEEGALNPRYRLAPK